MISSIGYCGNLPTRVNIQRSPYVHQNDHTGKAIGGTIAATALTLGIAALSRGKKVPKVGGKGGSFFDKIKNLFKRKPKAPTGGQNIGGTKPNAGPKPNAGSRTNAGPNPNAAPNPGAGTKPNAGPNPNAAPNPGAGAGNNSRIGSRTNAGSNPGAGSEFDFNTKVKDAFYKLPDNEQKRFMELYKKGPLSPEETNEFKALCEKLKNILHKNTPTGTSGMPNWNPEFNYVKNGQYINPQVRRLANTPSFTQQT